MIFKNESGKHIRDAVHGDIFIEQKFLDVIDTLAFQRLRRIKQLSVANMVFPSADHTRFSHSIGTFHIMKLMITHFEQQFDKMNLEMSNNDKEVALAAALLHDIGHGPFSHAYEDIHPNQEMNIPHAVWSAKIIKEDKEINEVLIRNFGYDFPNKVSNLIIDQRHAKKEIPENPSKVNLFYVLKRLVSSQLDADRLDYICRDSKFAGTKFAMLDIERLIKSMSITVVSNNYDICIGEKFVSDVENYLLCRWHMHKEVYYHSFKIEMEEVIKLIFKRVHTLIKLNENIFIPPTLKPVFSNNNLNVTDYLMLDDYVFMYAFSQWGKSNDKILKTLCETILNRNKLERIEVLDSTKEQINAFHNEYIRLLRDYDILSKDYNEIDSYLWIEKNSKYNAYKSEKENIWILKQNGTQVDLSTVSKILNEKAEKHLLHNEITTTFINKPLLRELTTNHSEAWTITVALEELIMKYDSRHHIEIEKKYYFDDICKFDEITKYFEQRTKNNNVIIDYHDGKVQLDTYYDNNDMLKMRGITLRIREKDNHYQLTIKTPTKDSDPKDQSIRFEHQIDVDSKNILDNIKFIHDKTKLSVNDLKLLKKQLVIINNRRKIDFQNRNVRFEIVYDDVEYIHKENSVSEYQLELELKSDYCHRTSLKELTDDLESNVNGLNNTLESKYDRGCRMLTIDK